MTINFVCRQSKSGKDGLSPLELYVIIGGKRRYVSLNRKITPKAFNNKRQMVKGDAQTNEYIEAVRMKCYPMGKSIVWIMTLRKITSWKTDPTGITMVKNVRKNTMTPITGARMKCKVS